VVRLTGMKVTCPTCRDTIPAVDVALDTGWAKCVRCDEVFPLGELLPGFSDVAAAPAVPERPFDAWAVVRREPRLLAVHLPAQGLRSTAWGMLVFAIIWIVFVCFWTIGALGILFGGQIQRQNAPFAAFSIPFWIVGFVLLGGVVWMSRGTRSVMIDAAQLVTELRCLRWRRTRTCRRDQVQCARAGQRAWKQEGAPATLTAEIIFTKGSFTIPCTSAAEQAWLVAEINDFLQNVPYDPSERDWMTDPARGFAG
jgi:hypothetical protein